MLQREAAIYSQLQLGHAPTSHMAQVLNLQLALLRLTLLNSIQVILQRVATYSILTLVLTRELIYKLGQT